MQVAQKMINKQKILIVDDREANLFTLEKVLKNTGAQIIRATSGNDALLAVQNHDFSLAILDVQMPEMDGYELAEFIRKEDKTNTLPIIFISAVHTDDFHIFKGYESGAVDFITKPFKPAILRGKVGVFLQLDLQRRELEDRRKMLEHQNARYAQIVASSTEAMALLDRNYTYLDANPSYRKMVGAEDAITGRHIEEILGKRFYRRLIKPQLDRCLAGEEVHFEVKASAPDGSPRFLDALYTPCRAADGSIIAAVCCVRDITERKTTEQALKASEENLKKIFNESADGILLADSKTKKFYMGNRTVFQMTGYSLTEIIGLGIKDIHPEKDSARAMEELERQAAGEGNLALDIPVKRKDGSVFYADLNVTPVALGGRNFLMCAFRDVTERKQMQASLAQSDRLAGLGMLAAGVAHEINNPLSYILYNLGSLAEDLPRLSAAMEQCCSALKDKFGQGDVEGVMESVLDPTILHDMIERAQDALSGTARIRDITRGLGTFSRVEQTEKAEVNIQYAIECAVNMAYNEIKYRARLVKDFGQVPIIFASDGRISQVFLNLLINAAHAIDEGDVENNEIRVRTWAEGDEAFAEVSDTGKGIPPENMDKLFEPFFTTKGVGVGSGLGLAICRTIVTEFGGEISVESEVGKGTCFTVRLPVKSAKAEMPIQEITAESQEMLPVRGRILVMDDEPCIRSAITRLLREHEVITVPTGEDGQKLLREDHDFDLILCDMMMPQMSGMDLHKWLCTRNAALADRMVFMTGGAFTPKASEYLNRIENLRLEKPFDAENLSKLVSKKIAARRNQ